MKASLGMLVILTISFTPVDIWFVSVDTSDKFYHIMIQIEIWQFNGSGRFEIHPQAEITTYWGELMTIRIEQPSVTYTNPEGIVYTLHSTYYTDVQSGRVVRDTLSSTQVNGTKTEQMITIYDYWHYEETDATGLNITYRAWREFSSEDVTVPPGEEYELRSVYSLLGSSVLNTALGVYNCTVVREDFWNGEFYAGYTDTFLSEEGLLVKQERYTASPSDTFSDNYDLRLFEQITLGNPDPVNIIPEWLLPLVLLVVLGIPIDIGLVAVTLLAFIIIRKKIGT